MVGMITANLCSSGGAEKTDITRIWVQIFKAFASGCVSVSGELCIAVKQREILIEFTLKYSGFNFVDIHFNPPKIMK